MENENQNTDTTTTTNDTNHTDTGRVTYTPEQQKHLDDVVIPSRLKRQREMLSRELDERHEAEKKSLLDELENLKSKSDDSALMRERALTKAALEGQRREAEEKAALQNEIASIRKRAAMDAAMGDLFVNKDVVAMLTDNPAQGLSVELDKDSGQYVVRENGALKANASLEPITLQQFYRDFAAKNAYLAAGTTRSGTGASESRTNGAQTKQILSKADIKSDAERIEYIKVNGYSAFAKLPLRRENR